jgi:protein-L-isoaspartate(D-aspartate) O-methyltransferase
VIEGDGTQVPFDAADVIYVNAGCTRPATRWLDGLADGGRLIMPMTSDQGFGGIAPERMASAGAVFRIERRAANYLAQWISPVAIFPCAGSRDEASERALAEAFASAAGKRSRDYIETRTFPTSAAGFADRDWCLAYH